MKVLLFVCWSAIVAWASYNQGWADHKPYVIIKPTYTIPAAMRISEGECKEICKVRARIEKVKQLNKEKENAR